MKRRDFLKLAILTLSGISIKPFAHLFTKPAFADISIQRTNKGLPRWAMVVNLSICGKKGGCTDCIDACNRIHNIPRITNPKHEVKWIWNIPFDRVFREQNFDNMNGGLREKSVLVLCNHCENPPCVSVCPTKATWKREDGIVMMDYHRCIGCRYCIAACPYGARSFNWKDPRPYIKEIDKGFPTRTRGIVEKCNFCEERIAKNLLPACVEACREGGLIFGDVNKEDSEVRKILSTRLSIRRKPHLGTEPKVYYIL